MRIGIFFFSRQSRLTFFFSHQRENRIPFHPTKEEEEEEQKGERRRHAAHAFFSERGWWWWCL